MLLVFPSGFGGVLADLRDGALRKIATRRGMVVPSLLADVRVEEVADAPPEETVLAEAAEIAELAEAEDGGRARRRWSRTPTPPPPTAPARRRAATPRARRTASGDGGRPATSRARRR